MNFFCLSPERPCDIWRYSVVGPNREFRRMVFAYDFWCDEPVFVDVPHYFVPRSVGRALTDRGLTGFTTVDVETIKSADYDDSQAGGKQPEPVSLLRVNGQAGVDDFGLQWRTRLIVSERGLEALRALGLKKCEVTDFEADEVPPSVEDFFRRLETKN